MYSVHLDTRVATKIFRRILKNIYPLVALHKQFVSDCHSMKI